MSVATQSEACEVLWTARVQNLSFHRASSSAMIRLLTLAQVTTMVVVEPVVAVLAVALVAGVWRVWPGDEAAVTKRDPR